MHPWLFPQSIATVDGTLADGDSVTIHREEDGEFIAQGLYNSRSQIRARLYSWQEADELDDSFFIARVDRAIDLRLKTLGFDKSDSFRVIYSEADQLSGLTVDKFGPYLSVQVSSLALSKRLPMILDHLQKTFLPKGIKIRGDRQTAKAEGFELPEEWRGTTPDAPFEIQHGGLKYLVDLRAGQKTGFYLDQRLNRLRVGDFARGAKVLDLFSYAGGFGLTCLKAGATDAIAVDSSEPAIALARENAKLNGLPLKTVEADVFEFLAGADVKPYSFDIVVADPPRYANSRKDLDSALRKYFKLNEEAIKKVKPGGILVTCSCSGAVDLLSFTQMLGSVGRRAGRAIQILETRGAAPDHPVSVNCPETEYLKCLIVRVN